MLRLNADGSDDATFSGDGGRIVVPGLAADNSDAANPDRTIALALDAGGKILVGNHTASGDFGIARITTGGNIDSCFGGDGIATADFGGDDDADALIVQPTGEILAVGTSLSGGTGSTGHAAAALSRAASSSPRSHQRRQARAGLRRAVRRSRELHVGDLVLRAFGTRQADGRVVVGTSNGTPQTQSHRPCARLNVPGTRAEASGTQIGTFGTSAARPSAEADLHRRRRHQITFTIKGGTGTAFLGTTARSTSCSPTAARAA